MDLREFLARPHRWVWGECDCTLFCGEWVVAATGRDPGVGLRGKYSTAAGARMIVDAHGGIAGLVGARLEPLGFARVQQPMDGDVGIVAAPLGTEGGNCVDGLMPAIAFGPLWAVMSGRGPMVKALQFTGTAWRIA